MSVFSYAMEEGQRKAIYGGAMRTGILSSDLTMLKDHNYPCWWTLMETKNWRTIYHHLHHSTQSMP
jgi:hypothetical protein